MPLDNAPAANSAPTSAAPSTPSASSAPPPNWDAFAGGADMNHAAPAAPEPRAPSETFSTSSSQPAPTSPQQAPPDWRGNYQRRGLDVSNYQSEDDLYADLSAYQRERPQLQQYAQIGAQLAPHAQRFAEWAQQQQQIREPQPVPDEDEVDPLDQAWGAPPYDPAWESQVRIDENTGEYVARHALVPHTVVDAYRQYQEHRRQKAVEFFNNPFKQTYQALEPKLKQAIRAEFEQLQQQHQQQQFQQTTLQQFEAQNAGWLYQGDGSGRPLIHPMTQQPVLSPMGQRFAQHVQFVRQAGVQDPTAAAVLAANNLSAEIARAQFAQQQMPAQPPAQQQPERPRAANGQFLPAAAAPPAGNHQAPPATPQQVSQNRIGQFLAGANQNAAFASPSFGAPEPTDGNWAVRNDRDLDHRLFASLDRAIGNGH